MKKLHDLANGIQDVADGGGFYAEMECTRDAELVSRHLNDWAGRLRAAIAAEAYPAWYEPGPGVFRDRFRCDECGSELWTDVVRRMEERTSASASLICRFCGVPMERERRPARSGITTDSAQTMSPSGAGYVCERCGAVENYVIPVKMWGGELLVLQHGGARRRAMTAARRAVGVKEPLKTCCNGCDAAPQPPWVLCKACLDVLDAKIHALLGDQSKRRPADAPDAENG